MSTMTHADLGTHRNTEEAARFGVFVEEHFDTLYRFAFCMSLAHDRAGDLTESVFCEARELSADGTADKRWMLTALHRKWSEGQIDESDLSSSVILSIPDTRLISARDLGAVDQSAVLKIVHGMPAELRLVISLFYFENLSHAEMAHILAIPMGKVVTRLADAKTLLRRRLEQQRTRDESGDTGRLPVTKGGAK